MDAGTVFENPLPLPPAIRDLKGLKKLLAAFKLGAVQVPETNICVAIGGTKPCKGDSGGPLMLLDRRTGRWVVAGVTSFGPSKCESTDSVGVYTRVDKYLDWIMENI